MSTQPDKETAQLMAAQPNNVETIASAVKRMAAKFPTITRHRVQQLIRMGDVRWCWDQFGTRRLLRVADVDVLIAAGTLPDRRGRPQPKRSKKTRVRRR